MRNKIVRAQGNLESILFLLSASCAAAVPVMVTVPLLARLPPETVMTPPVFMEPVLLMVLAAALLRVIPPVVAVWEPFTA